VLLSDASFGAVEGMPLSARQHKRLGRLCKRCYLRPLLLDDVLHIRDGLAIGRGVVQVLAGDHGEGVAPLEQAYMRVNGNMSDRGAGAFIQLC
jgi:hypothetical protein